MKGKLKASTKHMEETLERKMTHCPNCGKPILNGGIFPAHAQFNMRCPWCQATLEVKIQPRIMAELIKSGGPEGDKAEVEKMAKSSVKNERAEKSNSPKKYKLFGYVYPEDERIETR